MNGQRLLVCVDRSRAAFEAARLALRLADPGGHVRVVSVLQDSATARELDALGREQRSARLRLDEGVQAVMDRIVAMADDRHVETETEILHGDVLRTIMTDARRWDPDLILIGRTARTGPGSPLIGSLAMHVAEFTEWPVVLVPAMPAEDPRDRR